MCIRDSLYGFLLVVFPMVFLILLANRLLTRYLDRGSIAFLLATPNQMCIRDRRKGRRGLYGIWTE